MSDLHLTTPSPLTNPLAHDCWLTGKLASSRRLLPLQAFRWSFQSPSDWRYSTVPSALVSLPTHVMLPWQGFGFQLPEQAFQIKFQSWNGIHNKCFSSFLHLVNQQHNLISVQSAPYSDKHSLVGGWGGVRTHCASHWEWGEGETEREGMNSEVWETEGAFWKQIKGDTCTLW